MEEPNLDIPSWEAEPIDGPELPPFSPGPGAIPGPGEKEERAVAESKYLVIGLAGLDYAIALDHVLEIDHPRAITPLPHVPEWLLGISQVRGDILSVVDLQGLLNLERGRPPRAGRLLVVRDLRDGLTVGLLVERVREIARVPESSITPPAEPAPAALAPYLNRVLNHWQRQLPVLDLERLLQSPELRQFEPN